MRYGRELLKGSTDHLLLSLIGQEPMYGYQLIKEIGKRSRGYFEFKQGALYNFAQIGEGRAYRGQMGTYSELAGEEVLLPLPAGKGWSRS
jgi:hypothetical protein